MNPFLRFLMFACLVWCVPAVAVVVLIVGGFLRDRRRRPFRKADAPHDSLFLGGDERAAYAAIVAGRKRTAPEPAYDLRRQP